MSETVVGKFPKREVAERRVEWIIEPPQTDRGTPDYDRYEEDRYAVMQMIEAEFGGAQPQDLRLIEQPEETIISYRVQRVVLK